MNLQPPHPLRVEVLIHHRVENDLKNPTGSGNIANQAKVGVDQGVAKSIVVVTVHINIPVVESGKILIVKF